MSKMYALEVYQGVNGDLVIKQENFYEDDFVMILSAVQIKPFISMVKAVEKEIKNNDRVESSHE